MYVNLRLSVYVRGAVTGILVAIPVAITFVDNVGYPASVEGISMRPTLNPSSRSRDVVWVSQWSVRRRGVRRGDVVVLHSPTHPGDVLVKRVVGMEGEVVKRKSHKSRHVVVPPGHCWVEGDNQKSSRDSNLFGAVSQGLIFGHGTHIVWPPSRWRRLKMELLPEQRKRLQKHQLF